MSDVLHYWENGVRKEMVLYNPSRQHKDLSGLDAADAHNQYVTKDYAAANYVGRNGYQTIAGTLEVGSKNPNNNAQVYIHWPTSAHILLRSGNTNGYALRVCDPSDAGVLRPVRLAGPSTGQTSPFGWNEYAVTNGWIKANMTQQVSGPHGPHGHWHHYATWGGGPHAWSWYPSGALWYPIKHEPGVFKVTISAQISTSAGFPVELIQGWLDMAGRWSDGASYSPRNGKLAIYYRNSITRGVMNQSAFARAYLDNRPGHQLLMGGRLTCAGYGDTWLGLQYIHTFEFFPYAYLDTGHHGWVW